MAGIARLQRIGPPLLFMLAGCLASGDSDGSKDAPAAPPADEPQAEAPEVLPKISGAEFDPIAALDGTWILPSWRGDDSKNAPWGMRMLWEVDGTVLTESNGVTVLRYDLKPRGPCLVRAKRQDKNKISTRAVVFSGGELFTGTGGFDSPDGRWVHVCDQLWSRYLRVERGVETCTLVEQQAFAMTTTCTVTQHDDTKLVIDTGGNRPLKLVRQGTLWVEDKPGGSKPAQRYPDKPAAMAVLTGG